MNTIDRTRKLVLALFTIALTVALLAGVSTTALAQSGSGYFFDIRSIYTGPLGITNPAGVAFASPSNNLVILETPKAGQTKTALVLVPYREETAAATRTVAVADPLNLALSGRSKEFWLMERGTAALSAWPAQNDGTLGAQASKRFDVRAFGIQNPQGMTFDQKTGRLYILDAAGRRIIRIAPDAQGNLNPAAAGAMTRIELRNIAAGQLRGIAFNPTNGHLYVMDPNGPKLYELTEAGALVATRNLAELKIASSQGMVFGPSVDQTDNPSIQNLYVADAGRGNVGGRIVELSLTQPRVVAPLVASAVPTLIQTINTWQWSPPSPDPAGIVYWPAAEHLLMTDSEVDEIPQLFTGKNLFELNLDGTLAKTYNLTAFTNEPTGIAINANNGHWYIVEDQGIGHAVFEINLGGDDKFGTADDTVTRLFNTRDFGIADSEDIAWGANKLFIADGKNTEVWIIDRGANGRFDGPPPNGDDTATHFDTSVLGLRDTEGIAYDPVTGHLWVSSRKSPLIEVTTSGTLVRSFDISFLNSLDPDGVTLAPGSNNPAETHIWIADRMVDNNQDPNENDGRIYELAVNGLTQPTPTNTPTNTPAVGPSPTPTNTPTNTPVVGPSPTPTKTPTPGSPPANLLVDPGFELDANGDGLPDSWTAWADFTRSGAVVHGGSFAGRFQTSIDTDGKTDQRVDNLTAGATYHLSGWVNIPATADAFTFRLQVRWIDSANNTITTDTIKTYTATTSGWDQATGSLVAPAGTVKAEVKMAVLSLNATIYVDDLSFGQ